MPIDPMPMKRWLRLPLALACAATFPAFAADGASATSDVHELLQRYKCTICHAEDAAKSGPAFADIAARYRGDRGAVAHVARVIRGGQRSGGPWHMPPHPEVSPAEARAMARYILSLR
jgi:sulfite dehydrogenase